MSYTGRYSLDELKEIAKNQIYLEAFENVWKENEQADFNLILDLIKSRMENEIIVNEEAKTEVVEPEVIATEVVEVEKTEPTQTEVVDATIAPPVETQETTL